MAARARTSPATSVSMWPASASRARLPVRRPATTSTARKASVRARTRARRAGWRAPRVVRGRARGPSAPRIAGRGPRRLASMDQTAGVRGPGGVAILARFASFLRFEVCSVSHQKRLAILVGGGPAPGINSVIGAATIRGVLEGVEVLGIRDGFEWIMQGNVDHVAPADHRRGEPHPLPRRLAHRHLARQPDEGPAAPREHRHLAAAAERLAAHHDRRRRHRLLGDEARGEGRRAASRSSTSRRRSTTTSTCRPTSTPSASRPRATSASRSSRT